MKHLMIFIFLLAPNAFAGGAVGNGGDTVYCYPDINTHTEDSPYKGWYSLDYIIDKSADVQYADDFDHVIDEGEQWDTNFLRIMAAFKEAKYPLLYEDLKEFHDAVWSNTFAARYTWKKAPYGTVQVDDQALRQKIPPSCLTPATNNSVVQTILRTGRNWSMPMPNGPQYGSISTKGADLTYSTEVVSKLPALQLSFLLFHEWLRNFTDDPELIRDVNAIFHSSGWTGDDIDKKLDVISKLRLDSFQEMRARDRIH